MDIRQTYNAKYVFIFCKMNKQERMKAELKVVRVLKYWEDADFFSLKVKKKVADEIVKEIKECFNSQERRL